MLNNYNPETSATLGTPRKKGNGWQLQITYSKPDGTRARKTFGAKTKKEVINKRDEFLEALRKSTITKTSSATIPDLLREEADYLYHSTHSIKEPSYNRRIETIKVIKKSLIGKKPIIDVTENNIITFLGTLVYNYSDSVIKKIYSAISAAYKKAVYNCIVVSNIMDSPYIIRPKSLKPKEKVTALTPEQQKVFEEVIKNRTHKLNSNNYDLIMLIELHTGLRCGEICALSPECLDFNNNIIIVRRTITKDENDKPKMGYSAKTEEGIREVPMNSISKQLLKKAVAEYKENPEHVLFYDHRKNKLIGTNQVNSSFNRLCEKNGIKKKGGQHLLRHTFATRNIEAGISPEVLQKWLGHKDINVTLDTYTDVFRRRHNDAVALYDKYMMSN